MGSEKKISFARFVFNFCTFRFCDYNIDYTYSIIKDIPTGNYVRYRWSIIDGKEDDATGNDKATLDYNEKNPSAIINIKQPGLYTINCEIYLSTTGEVLGDAMYQPLVEN